MSNTAERVLKQETLRNSILLEHLHTASSSCNADHAESPAVMRHMTEKPTRLCWPPESRSRTRRPQVRTCPSSTSWPISPLIINGHNEILLKSTYLRGLLFQDMFAVLSSCLLLGQSTSALSSRNPPKRLRKC